MSIDWTAVLRMVSVKATARALQAAGCHSAQVAHALGAASVSLGAIPGAISASYHDLRPQLAAELPAARLGVEVAAVPSYVDALALEQALLASPLGTVAAELAVDGLAVAGR